MCKLTSITVQESAFYFLGVYNYHYILSLALFKTEQISGSDGIWKTYRRLHGKGLSSWQDQKPYKEGEKRFPESVPPICINGELIEY